MFYQGLKAHVIVCSTSHASYLYQFVCPVFLSLHKLHDHSARFLSMFSPSISPVAKTNSTAEQVDSLRTKIGTEGKPDPSDVYRLLSEKGITYDLNPEFGRQKKIMSSSITRVFVMRHGERVDFTFGHWLSYSLDAAGNYVQQDLNLPDQLPKRNDPQASVL